MGLMWVVESGGRSNKLPVVVPMPETKFHETVPDHTRYFRRLKRIRSMRFFCSLMSKNLKQLVECRIIREQIGYQPQDYD